MKIEVSMQIRKDVSWNMDGNQFIICRWKSTGVWNGNIKRVSSDGITG